MRARLALLQSKIQVELREVKLSQKPQVFIDCSAKATVPVLVLDNGQVLDESLDIMHWALSQFDPEQWEDEGLQFSAELLITENDGHFKENLDRYKYSDRYPEYGQLEYRQQAEMFLQKLEILLQDKAYLLAQRITWVDMAIMPFIRQFAGVEPGWFAECKYQQLREWLNKLIKTKLFDRVMTKYDFWTAGDETVYFPRH